MRLTFGKHSGPTTWLFLSISATIAVAGGGGRGSVARLHFGRSCRWKTLVSLFYCRVVVVFRNAHACHWRDSSRCASAGGSLYLPATNRTHCCVQLGDFRFVEVVAVSSLSFRGRRGNCTDAARGAGVASGCGVA